ncbi:sensor histidine kinase [Paenibacillus provencensis]|uniref:Sensor histidine kinase n=1 Tax=Paenibacillus provencensis TaxID=441151 RepID=A0ABW3PX22_9BACL
MDVTAEYINSFMKQVHFNEQEEKNIIISGMNMLSELIVNELGIHLSDIDQIELREISTKYQMNSIHIRSKSSTTDDYKSQISNQSITHIYTNEDIDYELVLVKEATGSFQESINERLNELSNSTLNYHDGQKIYYEFALFENGDANSISELVGYGTYSLLTPEDIPFINKAVNESTNYVDSRDNLNLEKSFMPLHVGEQTFVLCIISDHDMIQKVMMDEVDIYIYAIGICSVLFLFLCVVMYKIFNKNKDKALETVHVDYAKSMESIFLAVRQQRHDYNNAMATLHSLVSMKAYDDLHRYTGELIEEAADINAILNINCAPLVGLIQYKHTFAINNGVIFSHDISDIPNFKYRTNDIIRVVSNLIDNAIDAAREYKKNNPSEVAEVSIIGYVDANSYVFEVKNNGYKIQAQKLEDLTRPGFSTKKRGSGLGLSIVNSIVGKNKGRLTFKSDEDATIFKATFSLN